MWSSNIQAWRPQFSGGVQGTRPQSTARTEAAPTPPSAGSDPMFCRVLSEPWSSWRFGGWVFWAACRCRRGSGRKDVWRTLNWSCWWRGAPGRWWPSSAQIRQIRQAEKKHTSMQNLETDLTLTHCHHSNLNIRITLPSGNSVSSRAN